MKQVTVNKFYEPTNILPAQKSLCIGCELALTDMSKVVVTEKGAFVEYPTENNFPPYWRDLKDMKKGEVDLGKF